jgi:hypothetical protein
MIAVDGTVKYVGMSQSNAYKALYRHFQRWVDHRCWRATYDRETAMACLIVTDDAATLERDLIKAHNPPDNREYYPDHEPQEVPEWMKVKPEAPF